MIRALANAVAIAAALLALALDVWIVVPAPVLPLLAVAVLVPELAPWFAGGAALAAFATFALASGRARGFALACATTSFACALVPIAEYPFARAAAERALADGGIPALAGTDATPQAIVVREDLPVVTRDGTRLALDVYAPSGGGVHPTIVTVYGGAWIFGDRRQMRAIDRAYAARGYTTIAIDYRHAPAFHFPTQLHDVEDALAAIARRAAAWHVDRTRVALFGRSAGAELALLAAYEPEPLHVRAVVAYYAPDDLARGFVDPPNPDPADIKRILVAYLGAPPARDFAAYRAASPIDAVRAGLPPTLLIGGDRDELVPIRYQRAMRDTLRAHGDRVVAIEIPWSNHVFDDVATGLGASIATPATRRFLATHLGP